MTTFRQQLTQSYKSNDTEEWLDRVWTRPIGYLWACLFQRFGVHPNTVTILSMMIGAFSGVCFAHGSYYYEGTSGVLWNLLGVLLLAWANFYDSADGQLARMTGKKTQLGRILDGAASDVWFIPIYVMLIFRIYHFHAREFAWLGIADTPSSALCVAILAFFLSALSGLWAHARQCQLADYYRQIHLYFLKGATGSELDHAEQQRARYHQLKWSDGWIVKAFQLIYYHYTSAQERRTPQFQRLQQLLSERYVAVSEIPAEWRQQFRRLSLPLMPMTNILTFNCRAVVLYLSCLADLPWLYFVFEIVVLSLLCEYMRRRHETFCAHLAENLNNDSL